MTPLFSTNKLHLLVYNTDLPIFPGSGAHEFLNTTLLSQQVDLLGLVSLVHTQQQDTACSVFKKYPMTLYLWKNRDIQDTQDTTALPSSPSKPPFFYKKIIRKLYYQLNKSIETIKKMLTNKPYGLFETNQLLQHASAPLSDALIERTWHAVIVIQSSSAQTIDYVPKSMAKVLVMHDIRSLVYRRQAQSAKNIFTKLFCLIQEKRFFRFEQSYCRQYDLIVALSRHDADWIEKHYHPQKTVIVPIPVDLAHFRPMPEWAEVPNRIVFTGHMSHPPNVDAACYFAKDIFPRIQQAIPGAQFFIVGKDPSPAVLKLAELPGVMITGTVPDTRSYLATGSVIVVPLRFGSGVRNKILEAWGMKKCIISTSIGAEGLNYLDNVHLKIADTPETMAADVILALTDPHYREKLSQHGRSLAENEHNPTAVSQQYSTAVREVAFEKWSKQTSMRVAIDLRWMIPGRAGGIEQAARAFINQLGKADSKNEYVLLLDPRCIPDFDFSEHPNITVPSQKWAYLKKNCSTLFRKICIKLRMGHHLTPSTLLNLRFAHNLDVDLIYSFSGYIYPELYSIPNILTVHDIQHEYFPEFFSEYHLLERKRIFGDSIKIAKHITAISEYTRQTLIDKLKVNHDKISTVHLAADPYFTAHPETSDPFILKKYKLESNSYLFFPAHTWYHKNHFAALKALSILKRKHRIKLMLICTGGQREAQPYLQRSMAELDLEHQVRFLGYLPRAHIPAFYRGALALIYPSLFEGFGMPIVEAMNSGCPVICSNTTSLPEVAGEAALLTHPHDYEAMADNIYQLLKEPNLRTDLQKKGFAQASRFSWENHAQQTVALFQRIYQDLRNFS